MNAREGTVVQLDIRARHLPGAGQRPALEVHARPEAVSNFLRAYGIWQRPITAFAHQFLEAGDVAVDVGAHIGYFATVFADAVGPDGAVFAFEPDPDNFRLLERNRSLNGFAQISCRQVAVSDRVTKSMLHKSAANLGGSSLVKSSLHRSEIPVRTAPLDQLLERETRPLDLIKIDVEGAELDVLKGMIGLLGRQSVPPAIVMEFSSGQLEAADPGLHFFRDFLSRFGFHVRPFIFQEAPGVLPPRIEVETLLKIHQDLLRFGEAGQLDILLLAPEALPNWNI